MTHFKKLSFCSEGNFKRVDIFLNFYMKLEVIVWSNIRLFSWRDKIRFFL